MTICPKCVENECRGTLVLREAVADHRRELARVTRERDAALEVLRELAVRVQNYGPSPVMPEGQALYEALTKAARSLSTHKDTK